MILREDASRWETCVVWFFFLLVLVLVLYYLKGGRETASARRGGIGVGSTRKMTKCARHEYRRRGIVQFLLLSTLNEAHA